LKINQMRLSSLGTERKKNKKWAFETHETPANIPACAKRESKKGRRERVKGVISTDVALN
jgi:hypothetical protein